METQMKLREMFHVVFACCWRFFVLLNWANPSWAELNLMSFLCKLSALRGNVLGQLGIMTSLILVNMNEMFMTKIFGFKKKLSWWHHWHDWIIGYHRFNVQRKKYFVYGAKHDDVPASHHILLTFVSVCFWKSRSFSFFILLSSNI